jgi:hypothetical protein
MLVKVWNDNKFDYKEKFKGAHISIPAKSFIKMERGEASQFLGTMPASIQVDANGQIRPESYKMLRVEPIGPNDDKPTQELVCMQDGKKFQTQKELDDHIAENYMDKIADEDSRDEFKKSRGVNDTGTDRNGGKKKV